MLGGEPRLLEQEPCKDATRADLRLQKQAAMLYMLIAWTRNNVAAVVQQSIQKQTFAAIAVRACFHRAAPNVAHPLRQQRVFVVTVVLPSLLRQIFPRAQALPASRLTVLSR